MLLKDLMPGQAFMFEDRKTPLALWNVRGNHTPTGTFVYKGVGESACAKLLHVDGSVEIAVVAPTHYRSVLLITN